MPANTERVVVQMSSCEAPACGFVAVVEDPDTPYDSARELCEHYNAEHDAIDVEIAAERHGGWDRDDYRPYSPGADDG